MNSAESSVAIKKFGSEDSPTIEFATRIDFIHHRNYIHQNPVNAGIVTDPSEYRYCSAYPGFKSIRGPQRLKPHV
jgi:REP element-mobilizing transposase RayT